MTYTLTVTEVVEHIRHLFVTYGQQGYAEKCTQIQHAEQCATFAIEQGLDEEMALAAFLHDIGHFIAEARQDARFDHLGFYKHSELGAEFLRQQGFSERLCRLIEFHVQAKRYLAAVNPDYIATLSPASIETLRQQGGPMSKEQVAIFERFDDLNDILKLRELDDLGKLEEKACQPMAHWLKIAHRTLSVCRQS